MKKSKKLDMHVKSDTLVPANIFNGEHRQF